MITNQDETIDSREIIERIEELVGDLEDGHLPEDEREELEALINLRAQCEHVSDWSYGETLIRADYFVEYIEELIHDCYELPKELTSGAWPYRHIKIDYEAAAEEAKTDYEEVDFDGQSYYIRSV